MRSLGPVAGAKTQALALLIAVAALTSHAAAQAVRCPNSEVPMEVAITRRVVTVTANVDTPADPTDNTSRSEPGQPDKPLEQQLREPSRGCNKIIEQASHSIAVQSGVVTVATTSFTGALLDRLDTLHGQAATAGILVTGATDGLMGLGASGKVRPQHIAPNGAASPLSIYAMGTFGGGHRSDLPDMIGFNYESTSGSIGIEYRVNRNLIVGVAGNYATADATLTNSASVDVKAAQAAAYLSYATKAWFVDALVGYGRHDLDMARPDSGQLLRGSPDGNVLAVAIRGAYLFDLGGVRVGPIAGLTFVRSHLEGYTEAGNLQLALTVASQTVDTATASAGVRLLAPFVAGGKVVVPYLNVTLQHELGERARTLSASFAVQPQQPVFSAVPNFHTPTYGKVEGGVTFQLDDRLSATLGAASTFAREEGYDYRITAGLSYKF